MYPHERSLVQKLQGLPFALLGVNTDTDLDATRRRMNEENLTWPSWFQGGTSGPISQAWGVTGYPTLFLIDHRGIVRERFVGDPGAQRLEAAILELVQEAANDPNRATPAKAKARTRP
jgi:hypothetical protein